MDELPSGTVTLLFTDIEGSTSLVRELGDTWPRALDMYRMICRGSWAEFGGHELGTEGDSFFVVFARAGDAVHAAHRVQITLAEADWPLGTPIRARIGIHSGSPQRHSDGYVGMDVHRAARVAGAAHGGQVVVSESTKNLAAATLESGLNLLNLGEHQLKDIPGRMRLFQLTGPDLVRDFAALKSRGTAGSLPTLLTPTVGRDGELAELEDLLLTDHVRLITLTGPGGSGKTRLATTLAGRVADAFPDGVFVVELASATTVAEVWSGIARVLDVPADGHKPPGFFDYVADQCVLLVLDNLEQIADADEVVRDLLRATPHISVVVTSRRPLHVEGEFEHGVPPLLLPTGPSWQEIADSGAVQMFVQHALRVRRGFTLTEENARDVAALCGGLDGLPLAIELAAARVRMLTPAAILTRIDQTLDLSSPDRSRTSRQRTLRGAIEWSYDLLDAPHQDVLNHLGVFEGGASLEAIEAVVPSEVLAGMDLIEVLDNLLDTSLARVLESSTGEPRFTMLETIKRFAVEQLTQRQEIAHAQRAHAQHYYDQASHENRQQGRNYPTARADFLRDLNNYRAIIERGAQGITARVDGSEIVVPPDHVILLFVERAYDFSMLNDAVRWCKAGLELAELLTDPIGYARLAVLYEKCSRYWGSETKSVQQLNRALEGVRSSRVLNTSPTALPLGWHVEDVECSVVVALGSAYIDFDLAAAEPFVREAKALSVGRCPQVRARVHDLAYSYAYELEDFEMAYQHLQQSGEILDADGDPRHLLWWQNNMADLEMVLGRNAAGQARLARISEALIESGNAICLIAVAETFAAIIGPESPLLCARVFGAAEVAYSIEAMPRDPLGDPGVEASVASIRRLVEPAEWEAAWQAGRSQGIVDLLREMAALPLPTDSGNSVGN